MIIIETKTDESLKVNGKTVFKDMDNNWISLEPLTNEERRALKIHVESLNKLKK